MRLTPLATALPLLLLLVTQAAAADRPRVLILGFDGADFEVTRQLMEEGKLPHLARLAERGGFRPLMPTNPAQSPVSWATFATGMNPGKTGITDFLKRDPTTYSPRLALVARVRTRDHTPQEGARWAIRGAAVLAGVLVGWALLRLLLRRRAVVWIPVSVLLGIGFAYATQRGVLDFVPYEVPEPRNLRQGRAFWELLDDAGMTSVVVEAPMSFPAEITRRGRVLAGLGVPDIGGTVGLYSLWTTDEDRSADTEMGAKIARLPVGDDGTMRGWIHGARNELISDQEYAARERRVTELRSAVRIAATVEGRARARDDLAAAEASLRAGIPVTFTPDRVAGTVRIEVQDQTLTVAAGAWSDHVRLVFAYNWIVKTHGLARFLVARCDEEEVRILLTPVSWDLAEAPPNVRIAAPRDWGRELAGQLGPFDTLGWACVTSPLKDETMDEEAFLAHAKTLMDLREKKTFHLLANERWDCFVSVFSTTDRIQHMMTRIFDEEAPRHDPELAARFRAAGIDPITDVYVAMDRIVGRAMDEYLDESTVLIVLSDHGFRPFHRSVNLNSWLVRHGYLTLRPGASPEDATLAELGDEKKSWLSHVDWSKTRAYSMGLGKIYINLKGREGQGIVEPDEYDALVGEIAARLRELRDEERGDAPVVKEVYRRRDIYHGDRLAEAEDLILGFHPGYRVGWQTTLGGAPDEVIADNEQKWSGDHCSVDPSFVRGILLSSRPITSEAPFIRDLAPSVMRLVGLEPAKSMDGEPVIEVR